MSGRAERPPPAGRLSHENDDRHDGVAAQSRCRLRSARAKASLAPAEDAIPDRLELGTLETSADVIQSPNHDIQACEYLQAVGDSEGAVVEPREEDVCGHHHADKELEDPVREAIPLPIPEEADTKRQKGRNRSPYRDRAY